MALSIKKLSGILCALFILQLSFSLEAQTTITQGKLKWWKDAKFGMFIHWGLYSETAGYWKGKIAKGSTHFMLYEHIPWKEYGKIAEDFNPLKFDAEKWVLTAKKAGMKYLVITAKHHDGFAMYDSPSSDFDIKTCTTYGKDPIKELADACHKHNIKLGFYYSLGRDWQDPDVPTNWPVKAGRSNTWDFPDEDGKVFNKYFERKVKPQIRELLTQYGTVDILWFDTPELISKEESIELQKLIMDLQPNCIINSRIGNDLGDYKVKEQEIVTNTEDQPWEACITMSEHWSYIKYDTVYKSPELMIRQLLEIVSKGGNLLLNNGPNAEGEFTNQAKIRLKIIGNWIKKNSEGIYETHPWIIAKEVLSDIPMLKEDTIDVVSQNMKDAVNDATSKIIIPEVMFTAKGDDLFAFVCSWNGKKVLIKTLASSQTMVIKSVSVVGSSKKVNWVQNKDGLLIAMPSIVVKEIPVIGFRIKFQ